MDKVRTHPVSVIALVEHCTHVRRMAGKIKDGDPWTNNDDANVTMLFDD